MDIYNTVYEQKVQQFRKDIPFIQNNPDVVYLDNAATVLKTQQMIEAIVEYYSFYPANIHRASYQMSIQASEAYENARKTIKNFFSCNDDYEIIFTSGMTEGSNLLAYTHRSLLDASDSIAISVLEHHSSMLPWIDTARYTRANIHMLPVDTKGYLNIEQVRTILPTCSILSITGMSNVTGYTPPLKEILDICNAVGCRMIVDASQMAAHTPINLLETPYDAILCSGHKLGGPTGIGILCIKKSWLHTLPRFQVGGGTVQYVSLEKQTYNDGEKRFEAGTPHIAGVLGLSRAIEYIDALGWDFICEYEKVLRKVLLEQITKLEDITLLGDDTCTNSPIVSFVSDKWHADDISIILQQYNINVRNGHLCAQPLLHALNVNQVVRVSAFCYNTVDELIQLGNHISELNML